MPTTPKKASPTKAAAKKNGAAPRRVSRQEAQNAVDEAKNRPKHSEFRGIRLTLPPALPASFAFDALEIEEAGGMELKDIRRLLVGLLGEDQWRAIREKITADGDPMDDVGKIMEELLDAMLSPYGVSLGESQASAVS